MLALTLPTSGGHSVGIVRLRTKATEFIVFLIWRHMLDWKDSSTILDVSAGWRWVISFTPLDALSFGKDPSSTHWIGGWLGLQSWSGQWGAPARNWTLGVQSTACCYSCWLSSYVNMEHNLVKESNDTVFMKLSIMHKFWVAIMFYILQKNSLNKVTNSFLNMYYFTKFQCLTWISTDVVPTIYYHILVTDGTKFRHTKNHP
jgi:hypothetical protein